MLSFLFYSHNNLTKSCTTIISMSEDLEDVIVEKNWEQGYDETIKLIEYIQNNSTPLSIYVNHSDFDNLNCEAIKLTQYIENKDSAESLASLHLIKFSAETILNLQKISLKNIF